MDSMKQSFEQRVGHIEADTAQILNEVKQEVNGLRETLLQTLDSKAETSDLVALDELVQRKSDRSMVDQIFEDLRREDEMRRVRFEEEIQGKLKVMD